MPAAESAAQPSDNAQLGASPPATMLSTSPAGSGSKKSRKKKKSRMTADMTWPEEDTVAIASTPEVEPSPPTAAPAVAVEPVVLDTPDFEPAREHSPNPANYEEVDLLDDGSSQRNSGFGLSMTPNHPAPAFMDTVFERPHTQKSSVPERSNEGFMLEAVSDALADIEPRTAICNDAPSAHALPHEPVSRGSPDSFQPPVIGRASTGRRLSQNSRSVFDHDDFDFPPTLQQRQPQSPRPAPIRPNPVDARPKLSTVQRQSATTTSRRNSSHWQAASRGSSSMFNAPPPYMPQTHFYTAPDLGFDLAKDTEDTDDKSCRRFDSFDSSGCEASAQRARNVLLVGWLGGLDIYRVLSDKFEVIGRLEGLRGRVLDAKLLPVTSAKDTLHALRPLVVLVVHGLTKAEETESVDARRSSYEQLVRWQTTVEVYSIRTQQQVAVLYKGRPLTVPYTPGVAAIPPEPVGDLEIACQGSNITVSSGSSGEIFLFKHNPDSADTDDHFRCVGKYWTALQSSPLPDRSATNDLAAKTESARRQTRPLMALGTRWLAIIAPSSSATTSIDGSPLTSPSHPQPPGLNAHQAPMQPPITTELHGPGAEGVMATITRHAAQEVIKASRKGIELGMAGWREFTNPSPAVTNGQSRGSVDHGFPPTHAPPEDHRRLTDEPAVISLIDTDAWVKHEHIKHSPYVATFALASGCNYMSLSNDGLKLLTVNRNGDEYTVWDLSSAAHAIANPAIKPKGVEEAQTPFILHQQRVARASSSVVMESAWSRDDDWLALQTTQGTVHLHHLSNPTRSPPRKRATTLSSSPRSPKSAATVGMSQGISPPSSNGFFYSIRSGLQNVSTQVNAFRANTTPQALGIPTTFAGLKDTANAARMASSRAVARGLSQGYSAAKSGMGDIWHAEDNKIRLKDHIEQASLRWIRGRDGAILGIVSGRSILLHPIRRSIRQRGEESMAVLKVERGARREFALPPTSGSNSIAKDCAKQGLHGFWNLWTSDRAVNAMHQSTVALSHRTDEVESNPVFCPFHVDSRVSMMTYRDDDAVIGAVSDAAWCFGDALPVSKKMNDAVESEYGSENEPTQSITMPDTMVQSTTVVDAKTGGIDIMMHPRRNGAEPGYAMTDDEMQEMQDETDMLL